MTPADETKSARASSDRNDSAEADEAASWPDTQHSPAIDVFLRAAENCAEALDVSLAAGGVNAEPDHIRLLSDASETCRMAASFIARDSVFRAEMLRMTADVCRAVVESCQRLHDPMLTSCVAACRACISECEQIVVRLTWQDEPVRSSEPVERPIH